MVAGAEAKGYSLPHPQGQGKVLWKCRAEVNLYLYLSISISYHIGLEIYYEVELSEAEGYSRWQPATKHGNKK